MTWDTKSACIAGGFGCRGQLLRSINFGSHVQSLQHRITRSLRPYPSQKRQLTTCFAFGNRLCCGLAVFSSACWLLELAQRQVSSLDSKQDPTWIQRCKQDPECDNLSMLDGLHLSEASFHLLFTGEGPWRKLRACEDLWWFSATKLKTFEECEV